MFDDTKYRQDQAEFGHPFLYFKWACDGAATLSEWAKGFESIATELRNLEESGWQLLEPVDDGKAFMHHPAYPVNEEMED